MHAAGDQTYSGEGYPIPNEDDYYQQEPANENNDGSSLSSAKKGKPMPKESSFFIFSSKNR